MAASKRQATSQYARQTNHRGRINIIEIIAFLRERLFSAVLGELVNMASRAEPLHRR